MDAHITSWVVDAFTTGYRTAPTPRGAHACSKLNFSLAYLPTHASSARHPPAHPLTHSPSIRSRTLARPRPLATCRPLSTRTARRHLRASSDQDLLARRTQSVP